MVVPFFIGRKRKGVVVAARAMPDITENMIHVDSGTEETTLSHYPTMALEIVDGLAAGCLNVHLEDKNACVLVCRWYRTSLWKNGRGF